MAGRWARPSAVRWLGGLLVSVISVGAVSGVIALLDQRVPALNLLVLYILAVLAVAVGWGTGLAVVTAILSTAVFGFLFVSPVHSVHVGDSRDLIGLGVFLVTAVVVGQLAARARRQAQESGRLSEEQSALRRVATLVAQAVPPPVVFEAVTREVGLLCGADLARMERYENDGTVTGVAAWGQVPVELTVGTRLDLDGLSIARGVRQTGGAVRVDSFGLAAGAIAREARAAGIRASVGCPIVVGGRLWGGIAASTKREEPFPPDVETRIAGFTELVATAIANAQAHEELRALAEEQAALRRVATLVARGEPPAAVFTAVAEEIGRLLPADFTIVGRYEPDDVEWTGVGGWSRLGEAAGIGHTFPLGGEDVATRVRESGRPARMDDYADASGSLAADARASGIGSSVGVPITVAGQLWGVTIASSTYENSLPAGTDQRLADFTELVATAIANAQARQDLRTLADEQAALRRVATRVAQGQPPGAVFAAVAEEVGRLLPADRTLVGRYDPDGQVTRVGDWTLMGDQGVVGTGVGLGGRNVTTMVYETRRPARLDSDAAGAVAAEARDRGVSASVGVPITVAGRLWGVMVASSTRENTLPPDTDQRLADFTELVATAIANAEAHAELTDSRARIVATADQTRRRIERDLHDGAQQRLVSLGLRLRAAATAIPPELGEVHEELAGVDAELDAVQDDLRELSRGIHPAILSEGGLRPALRALARRSPIPVQLQLRTEARLPEPVEVTAYYVISEALTNVAKHASASLVRVDVDPDDGLVRLHIRDDGVGGADPSRGSGLLGLKDRVEATHGTLRVDSRPGQGTSLLVKLPLDPGQPPNPIS
jgi:signal transduction histidine kinase